MNFAGFANCNLRHAEVIAIEVLDAAINDNRKSVELLLRTSIEVNVSLGKSVILGWLTDRLRYPVLEINETDSRTDEIPPEEAESIVDEAMRWMGYPDSPKRK